jgi:hypothetical protein
MAENLAAAMLTAWAIWRLWRVFARLRAAGGHPTVHQVRAMLWPALVLVAVLAWLVGGLSP